MIIAIKASLLLDGNGGPPLPDPVLLIQDGRIEGIFRQQDFPYTGLELFEFNNGTILPGLIDAHLHLIADPNESLEKQLTEYSDEILLQIGRRNAKVSLQNGITTVRDCGARGSLSLRLKSEIAAWITPGPHMLACGSPITTVRGHCWFMGGAFEDFSELMHFVRNSIAAGIDFLKVMATGGGSTPGSDPLRPQFTLEELRAFVDLAHSCGLRAAAHVHGTAALPDCLRAGFDTIEHCSLISLDGHTQLDGEILELLSLARPYIIPTIAPYPERHLESKRHVVQLMYEAGLPIVAGTDAGVPGVKHGDLQREMALLAQCGIPLERVINAATLLAAAALGIEAETGSIELGKRADILVVGDNPLVDLRALRNIKLIMKAGEIVAGLGEISSKL